MKKRVGAAVLCLCVLTGVWMLFLFDSLQFYSRYVRDYYENCEQAKQRYLEEYGLHVDFGMAKPYWEWNGGGLVLLAGLAVLGAWTTVVLKVKAVKDLIRRHKFDAAAMVLMFAASFIVFLTYTRYRYNLDTVLFSDFDGRDAVLVAGSIPKTISLGTIDPLNPFVYEPPSKERVWQHGMPTIVPFYPLTEEQKTVVNWYETWGGIREYFIAPALYLSGKLLIKGLRRTRTSSRGDQKGLSSMPTERKENDHPASESWLRRPGPLIGLLIVCTMLWTGLYGEALLESSEQVYWSEWPDAPRVTLNVTIITGLPLSAAWTITAVKRRKLLLACAATGTLLAFSVFVAANTENLSYTTEYAIYAWLRRGYIVRLNPLLHLGGGTLLSYYAAGTAL